MSCGGCGKAVGGAVGLLKVAAQAVGIPIDQSDKESVAARLNICRDCPEATLNTGRMDRPTKGLTTRSKCRQCGCYIKAKVRVASEVCPRGKW